MGTPEPKPKPKPKADANAASPIKYAYMFESDKGPTRQFDALLRAISSHIINEIGDKKESNLTPKKLAAFYKAVGGTYDSLFVDNPHPAISYIWRVTGCQHSLQPTGNDFEPPSIPALTIRGFSRWESLQVLLDPEEHVPFLQFAAKNWSLKHPDTGELFPPELPKDVFPAKTDVDVDRWHQSCADQLREEAGPKPEAPHARGSAGVPETVPEHDGPKFTYVHVRNPFNKGPPWQRHAQADHSARGRSFGYHHVPPGRYTGRRGSDNSSDKDQRDDSPTKEQERRRSFSDYPPTAEPESRQTYPKPHPDHEPARPSLHRRHSHPHHYSTDDSDDEPPPRSRRRGPPSPPQPSVRRFVPPTAPQPPSAMSNGSHRAHRAEMREDHRKRDMPSPRGGLRNKLSETVSNILPHSHSDRSRNASRNSSYDEARPRRNERAQPSRLGHSYSESNSDLSLDDGSSEDEASRRRRLRDDRDRGHRDRGRGYREDMDDRDSRRPPQHLQRPDLQRRTSSHADIDRRRDQPPWDSHDRDRLREERKKWDRRMQAERGQSPITGVAGRRYPEPAYS